MMRIYGETFSEKYKKNKIMFHFKLKIFFSFFSLFYDKQIYFDGFYEI